MGCSSETKVKAHHLNIWLEQPNKLAVAENITRIIKSDSKTPKSFLITSDYKDHLIRWKTAEAPSQNGNGG
jgi:hypothetical protein